MSLTALVIIVITGCQKVSDDPEVNLKSTSNFIDYAVWNPAGGASVECTADGLPACGSSYKFEEWVAGDMEMNGIKITYNDGKTFNWESMYPVCKVIVKAGRGARVYYYPGGAYSDNGLIGWENKGISHVTFCYDDRIVIAVKVKAIDPYECETDFCYTLNLLISSPGDVYPFTCGSQYSEWGASYYEKGDEYLLKELYGTQVLGNVVVTDDGSNLMVQINVDEGLYLGMMYLYVGPLSGLGSCPAYTSWPFQLWKADSNTYTFTIPMDEI